MLRTSDKEYVVNKRGEEKKNVYWRVNSEEDLININKKIIALADKLGKLTVATGDVHFLSEHDAKFRAVIMASKGFDDADLQPPLYFKTTREMLDDFAWAGDRAKEFVIYNPKRLQTALWMLFRRFRREPSSRILTVQTKNSRKNAGAGQKSFTATPCPNMWQAAFSVSLIQLSVTASVCFMLSQKGLLRKAKETATL